MNRATKMTRVANRGFTTDDEKREEMTKSSSLFSKRLKDLRQSIKATDIDTS
jgi:hypothetical protein